MGKRPKSLVIYTDGGARGNPGPAGGAVIISRADDGAVLFQGGFYLGQATNNVAEYHALLEGLERARRLGAQQLEVRSDSELLVRQMNGQYRVRQPRLRELFERAQRLCRNFTRCSVVHIRRQQNAQADRLVNQAINLGGNVGDAGRRG